MDVAEAKGEDLLYVSSAIYTKGNSDVFVFSYPGGKSVGTLTGFSDPVGECVDRKGDVFITDFIPSGAGHIYEYQHGGALPVATLSDPLAYPEGCSTDRRVSRIGVWRYPKGGNPVLKYGNFGQGKFARLMGVTVSVAPSR